MFESSLPFESTELMRVSDFQRQQEDLTHDVETVAGATRLTSLSASLLNDLQRFDLSRSGADGLEALEVLAAAVRHGQALLLHLQHQYRVIPLTIFPGAGAAHCTLPLQQLLGLQLSDLLVLHVEPARLPPPVRAEATRADGAQPLYAALSPLLWEMALRGARDDLLPEIAGRAAYRVAPGAGLHLLELTGSLAAAVDRLRRETSNLREIASWPGFDHARAMRLLNGLYLHAALIVSRTHPAATDPDRVGGG